MVPGSSRVASQFDFFADTRVAYIGYIYPCQAYISNGRAFDRGIAYMSEQEIGEPLVPVRFDLLSDSALEWVGRFRIAIFQVARLLLEIQGELHGCRTDAGAKCASLRV